MNKTAKTVTVLTAASAYAFVQGYTLGQFAEVSPLTAAAWGSVSASTSVGTVHFTYNTNTDDPIDIVAPVRDPKSQA
jgi:hypothetical protein